MVFGNSNFHSYQVIIFFLNVWEIQLEKWCKEFPCQKKIDNSGEKWLNGITACWKSWISIKNGSYCKCSIFDSSNSFGWMVGRFDCKHHQHSYFFFFCSHPNNFYGCILLVKLILSLFFFSFHIKFNTILCFNFTYSL